MICKNFTYTEHAITRMFNREIEIEDVERIALDGEIIANYPTDKPFPSYLKLGYVVERPLHVLIGFNPVGDCVIITAYEPDKNIWNIDFKTKNKK